MLIVIYAVECLRSGFTYVGLSSDYKRRWRQHRSLLRRGLHATSTMIADWRKHGESAFELRVLEVLPYGTRTQEAEKAELRWQAHFARLGRLYNAPKCTLCGRPLDNFATAPSAPNSRRQIRSPAARRPKGAAE
jgi:GIY-YIG catalytic domain